MPVQSKFPLHHGRISLSFAGTVGDRGSDEPIERLADPKAFGDWLQAARLVTQRQAIEPRTFEAALQLREAIAAIVRAVVTHKKPMKEDVNVLNAVVRRWGSRPMLDPATLNTVEDVSDPVQAALGRIARDAVELVGDKTERARLRQCGDDNCASVFLTPPGRERKWCSMARCGNRAKAAGFRARRAAV